MKKFWNWLYSTDAHDFSSDAGHIYNLFFTLLMALVITVISFLLIFLKCNLGTAILTFLMVAGASFAGGAALGFLFGLPRAGKNKPGNNDTDKNGAEDNSYGDNTNLEEVSDWLTKIIVGLTLIKLNTIIAWIDRSARSVEKAFKGECKCDTPYLDAYVFGYCTIILFFLVGAGLCYLWARTNLSVLLTKSKLAQKEVEKQDLISKIQAVANKDLNTPDKAAIMIDDTMLTDAQKNIIYPTAKFRSTIENVYNAKTVFDKTDLQKGRWGSEAKRNDYVLEGNYITDSFMPGIYKVQLVVRSLNINRPLKDEVAFFLHDSFPSQIVYTVAINNKAEITINAYEAFVAGARLEDGTELEIDLNKVKGFPDGFYWKN